MNRYRVCGTVSVDIYAEIDAPTLEDALEYARDNFRMEEYCNGSVGCEDGGYEFGDAEVTCCCDIDWYDDYSELVEENIETETDIWDSDEDDDEEPDGYWDWALSGDYDEIDDEEEDEEE